MADCRLATRPRLYACREVKEGLRRLYDPAVPSAFVPLKPVVPGLATFVVSTLPRWARRRMYGLPGLPTSDLAATAALKALYRATRLVPASLRYPPEARRARALTEGLSRAA